MKKEGTNPLEYAADRSRKRHAPPGSLPRPIKNRRMVTFMRVFLLVLFLAVWELCSDFNVIDAFFFSSPSRVSWSFSPC